MANWRNIAGENNWHGLLDPNLGSGLRQRLVDCGERVQAIYDAIDDDKSSTNYGFPKHDKTLLYSRVGPDKDKPVEEKLYEVKEYIYAFADVASVADWIVKDRSVWIGYVAVATNRGKQLLGRRDILICWRGTAIDAEWLKNAEFSQISDTAILKNSNQSAYVHKGFHSLYTKSKANATHNKKSAREQVLDAVKQLLKEYKTEEISITITGHSLGAALATLNAADIASNRDDIAKEFPDKKYIVTAFVFASPMVGNFGFNQFFTNLPNLHLLQIHHFLDVVPRLPDYSGLIYVKTGFLKVIQSLGSNFLNNPLSPSQLKTYFHNLKNLIKLLKEESQRRPRLFDGQKNYALVADADAGGQWKVSEVPSAA